MNVPGRSGDAPARNIGAMELSSLIAAAQRLQPGIVALRRDLHRHPEIGNYLPQTRAIVEAAVQDLPIDLHRHESTSGLVAVLGGHLDGPAIILRGDMDALPMPEDTGLEFASEIPGVMHACGHDLHTAMLVGAARLLTEYAADLPGPVVFMFQPGEEGHHGAKLMLDEGLLDVVRAEKAFALHVSTAYVAGSVQLRAGPQMASSDEIEITVTGAGGHASAPHRAVDPVPIAAEIVMATQVAMTRRFNVHDPGLVTFGKLAAGTTHNVIPERAVLRGTVRAFSDETRRGIQAMLEDVVTHIAAAHGATAQLSIEHGYPVTVNDGEVAALVDRVARATIGDDMVAELSHPIMGSEDWSYVLQRVPGVMAFLGACPAGLDPETAPSNHSNRVVFDEAAMTTGVALHAAMAFSAGAG